MKRAEFLDLGQLTKYRIGVDSYDSTKLGLGNLMVQSNGIGQNDYVGPMPIALARPMEQTTAIASAFPWAIQWSNSSTSQIDWIFLADISTAAATRRINAYSLDRTTSQFTWKGFVTVTFPTATAYTIRGFRMTYDLYSTGTVAVSGTAVTGTTTAWLTNKCCIGNRIGFGSTNPALITTWYEISAMASDTSITLSATAGTISAGTAYVIEDLRCVMATTNATTTNGGLCVVKGLNWNQFSSIGGTVPAATTVDNIRACYWLADAATVTNTVSFGMGIEPKSSSTSQMVYVFDTLANPIVFKYNIRAALTLTGGKDTTTLQFKTGAGGAVTGTVGQNNNGRYAVVSHGPYSGQAALYFTTTTRVYGTLVSNITNASTTWLSSGTTMTEVPPGGVNTFAAGANLANIEYASTIDKFIITNNTTTTPLRHYITQYRTDNGQLDRIWGYDIRQLDQSTADSSTTPVPSFPGAAPTVWAEGGLCYIAYFGTTAILNRLYAVPFGADWEYSTLSSSYIITPAISISNASNFLYAYANHISVIGGATTTNLGLPTEPFRVSFRTSGISDNSGSWTLLTDSGDMGGATGSAQIQFKLEFRTIGQSCIPARVQNLAIVYNDNSTDSHFQLSLSKSSTTSKQFAWRFSTAFGSTVPTLYIRIYDAVTNSLLVSDSIPSPTAGTIEKSTDGTTWGAYNTTDKANETTYIRYTPTSIADNINVKPVISLA